MASCKVKAHVLEDAHVSLAMSQAARAAGWRFDDFQKNEPWRSKMISFTSLLYHPKDGLVYCGLTSFANKILYSFDPETKQFEDLQYDEVGERFDVKIHRSFELDDDGTIMGATAGLHDFGHNPEAQGGKVFRFYPETKKIEILGIPVPHDYIQTIALDRKRQIVYGNCYPLGSCFAFDLKERKPLPFKWGGGVHKARCDNEGNFWGISDVMERRPGVTDEQIQIMEAAWNMRGSIPRLFKYNPDDGYQILPHGLPSFSGQPQGIANMLDGDDGYMYIGTGVGALYRVEKSSGDIQYLGIPNVGGRLEGMAFDRDGLLYLGGGSFYQTRLSVYDRETQRFTDLGPIYDEEKGEICIIVHALCITEDGLVYIGETDNMERSGYLWECQVQL